MPRTYDSGKNQYAKDKRVDSSQHTRHILPDKLLGHYQALPDLYADNAEHLNYRMGSSSTNGRDTQFDKQWENHINGKGFDKSKLYKGTKTNNGMSNQQQLNALTARAVATRNMYQMTADESYLQMNRDLKDICKQNYNTDMRSFPSIRKKSDI